MILYFPVWLWRSAWRMDCIERERGTDRDIGRDRKREIERKGRERGEG